MSSIGHHLVRRAFDATQEHFSSPGSIGGSNTADQPQGQDDKQKKVMMCALALVWFTGIVYMAIMSAVRDPSLFIPNSNTADHKFLDFLHLRRCHCNLGHD